ncbi:hypothetical protein ATCC90586_000856 [Pythium insidiosum]|nr:hypothetical protein ATCC90586_000856 [Pythium insidiosum]
MQRDRLEGWMVKQIELADLAKETVIQLPSPKAPATPAIRSPRSAVGSPRRRHFFGHSAPQRPITSTPQELGEDGGAGRMRTRHLAQSRIALASATSAIGDIDASDSVARQWRLRFEDPDENHEERGRVDRRQLLKDPAWGGSPPRTSPTRPALASPRQSAQGAEQDKDDASDDDEAGPQSPRGDDVDLSSPLLLWGVSRDYILEYIRHSIMPTTLSTHGRLTGKWKAAPPSSEEEDGRYSPRHVAETSPPVGVLPPLSARSKSVVSSPRPSKQLRRGTARRPTVETTPTSPRVKTPRGQERIQRVLAELRADPKLWEAFQRDVQRYLDEQRQKIRENKLRVALSPRAPEVLAERKKRHDARLAETQRQRERLMQEQGARLEAKLLAYQRRVLRYADGDDDLHGMQTVAHRRRKMWLVVVAFANASLALRRGLHQGKQRLVVERMQTAAARAIQHVWRKWKWRHASKHTVVIYTWLRRCLWRLLFRVRCRRKARHATVLQRFMLDHFSGSRETRNFNRMMVRWRSKVIHSQRFAMAFLQCTRARLHALSLWWDQLDHERQRIERQAHEKLLPTTDEKEAEWNAIVSGGTRRGAFLRRGSFALSTRALVTGSSSNSSANSSNGSGSGATASGGATAAGAPGSSVVSLARMAGKSTRQLLDQMDERLTTMQQVLTPIEIQRLQQHAFHVVKVPRAVKMRLLLEHLRAMRKDFISRFSAHHEQLTRSSYTREVRLVDARAIVQSGSSWDHWLVDGSGSGGAKSREPIFQLFSGEKQQRMMEELLRRGIQLTLEGDPEQRAIVERQRQQRQALETGISPLTAPLAHSTPARKRDSMTTTVASTSMAMSTAPAAAASAMAPTAPSAGTTDTRKSTRKLTFSLPAKHKT